ncbi:MAG: FAD:protein FMN transferase [Patescibacteria group bacterium]|nr:FAD:protein FMN transferase [Patescibacteria group bacterium]
MKETRIIMGMPVTVEVVSDKVKQKDIDDVFSYFRYVDEKFSTYKEDSEISKINRGEVSEDSYSKDVVEILRLSEDTKRETDGYFDITAPDGMIDPSGIVKGWSIYNASKILQEKGFSDFYVDAGGDIQTGGKNSKGEKWSVGIRNPLKQEEIVKVVYVNGEGVATSGTYIRGRHIYNPKNRKDALDEIVSLTVVGPNIYEADRFATAAFAMGESGIGFIERLSGFEGYAINRNGIASMTSGFEKYTND